jgi:hypothetical protein
MAGSVAHESTWECTAGSSGSTSSACPLAYESSAGSSSDCALVSTSTGAGASLNASTGSWGASSVTSAGASMS